VLAPFALRTKIPNLRDMFIVSMTLIVLQFGLIFSGQYMGLTVATVVITAQLGVPFACLLAAIFSKDYLGPWRSFGLMVAFMGVVIIAGTPNASAHWGAFLMTVAGAFCWSVANIYMKHMKPAPVIPLLFWTALFSVPPLALLSLAMEQGQGALVMQAHWSSWLAIAYSVFLSSIVGYGVWSHLIKKYPMSQVVPYGLLSPVAGVSAGALIFGEVISGRMLFGAALTILGVAVITLRRPQLIKIEQ
jgi:O-acetylserine/cysteine efflux transporter